MKTYSLSKQDMEYLQPIYANMQAINTAIQVYIINVLFPRLGLPKETQARYDITRGEIYVVEAGDEAKASTNAGVQSPPPAGAPNTVPPQQPRQTVKTESGAQSEPKFKNVPEGVATKPEDIKVSDKK